MFGEADVMAAHWPITDADNAATWVTRDLVPGNDGNVDPVHQLV
jgi:uncharacterized protein affecting Mg2+/Co2+ transport